MSADSVDINAARKERATGNGAREAMAAALSYCQEPIDRVQPIGIMTETMLMRLWELGFKVVPIDDGEKT